MSFSIRLENKVYLFFRKIISGVRSTYLFGSFTKVKFGKSVRLSGDIKIGTDVSIQDYSKVRGTKIRIGNNVFIHENVFIRGKVKIIIGEGTTINRNTCVLDDVSIGRYCSIAPNCVIVGSSHNFNDKKDLIKNQGSLIKGIVIEDDVWIAANATILDGVVVGEGSVVAAGAVVTESVAPYSIVGGVPAKVIGERGS